MRFTIYYFLMKANKEPLISMLLLEQPDLWLFCFKYLSCLINLVLASNNFIKVSIPKVMKYIYIVSFLWLFVP